MTNEILIAWAIGWALSMAITGMLLEFRDRKRNMRVHLYSCLICFVWPLSAVVLAVWFLAAMVRRK